MPKSCHKNADHAVWYGILFFPYIVKCWDLYASMIHMLLCLLILYILCPFIGLYLFISHCLHMVSHICSYMPEQRLLFWNPELFHHRSQSQFCQLTYAFTFTKFIFIQMLLSFLKNSLPDICLSFSLQKATVVRIVIRVQYYRMNNPVSSFLFDFAAASGAGFSGFKTSLNLQCKPVKCISILRNH